jgi:hypothetical protein
MTTPDEFAQSFDAIEIARAPSPSAIDAARVGFHLEDDAGGRFVIDREFGVVSLRDEGLLAAELGRVHAVQLRVVESSGHSYVLDLQLRVTGMVPQMVGAEDFGLGADAPTTTQRLTPSVPWTAFAPVRGRQATTPLTSEGAYGALFSSALPLINERVDIAFTEGALQPAHANAEWSL